MEYSELYILCLNDYVSDLLEHVGTKHAGDEGAFNDQHQNSHQVMPSASCLREVTLFEASERFVWERAVENGRGAGLSAHGNGNSNLVRLWSLNCSPQKIMNVGAVFSARYHPQHYDEALADMFSKM